MRFRPNISIISGFALAFVTCALIGQLNTAFFIGLFLGSISAGITRK